MTESGGRGRILGLDVGERRIGVAVSDPDGHFALPLRSIDRAGRSLNAVLDAIDEVARDHEASEIVVGLPLSLSGAAGPQAETTTAFARELAAHNGLPVHLYDERLSTQEALHHVGPEQRGRKDRGRAPTPDVDAIAASIILQAYLDSRQAAPS